MRSFDPQGSVGPSSGQQGKGNNDAGTASLLDDLEYLAQVLAPAEQEASRTRPERTRAPFDSTA